MLEAAHQIEEGEESYFISMTDIMVGMLFVFIILLMYFVFQIQNTSEPMIALSEHKRVLGERDDARSNLDVAMRRIAALEDEIARLKRNAIEQYLTAADRDRTQLLLSLQKSMKESTGITVEIVPDQGIFRLPEQFLFGSGHSKLYKDKEETIGALGKALFTVLECFSVGPFSHPKKGCNPNASFIDAILIEGHTDDSPIKATPELPFGPLPKGGTSPLDDVKIFDNLGLSAQRATNAVRALKYKDGRLLKFYSISSSEKDKPLGKGTSPLINAAAFGDTRPAFSNSVASGKMGNRRIDLRLLMYSPRAENLDAVRKLLEQ